MNVKAPKGLDFVYARTAWPEWIERFNRYRSLTGLDEKSTKKQVDTLVYVMGEEAERIYKQLVIATGSEDTLYDRTVAAFEKYFNPQSSTIHYRIMFNKRMQKADETNECFIKELHDLSLKCGWDDGHRKSQMTTQLLAAMNDKMLSQELQLLDTLSLDVVTQRMRAKEVVRENQRLEMDGTAEAIAEVCAVRETTYKARNSGVGRGRGKGYDGGSKHMITNCKYCTYSHGVGRCPAYGKKCNACSGLNHFRKACQKNSKQVNSNHNSSNNANSDSDDEFSLDTVCDVFSVNSAKWIVPVLFKESGVELKVKVDTGAEVNVMPVEAVKTLGVSKLKKTAQKLTGYSGDVIPLLGRVDLELEYRGRSTVARFYIRETLSHNSSAESLALLGLPTLQELNVVPRGAVSEVSAESRDGEWVAKYPSVFGGLGKVGEPISLKLKDDACPKAIPCRHVPLAQRQELKQELERLVAAGVIIRDDEPCEWLSPIVRVRKPNGSLRICLDPQNLNENLVRNRCEIPTTAEIFAGIQGARYFSKLDAVKGFHQIPIDLESSKLTSFLTPFGKFRYVRMPMGIKTAPEIFHGIVSQLFDGIPGVFTYIDDILIVGSTVQEHDDRLKQVLDRCLESGLTLSAEKSVLKEQAITFLGHELSCTGIRPANDKLETLRLMTRPQDKKEAQKFLGFVTYLAKFVPDLAGLTEPIREVCKKFVCFGWNKPQQESFERVKAAIMSSPTLGLYDPAKPLTLSVDASSVSVGACLMQDGRPIEFASKSLTGCQRNYAQIEKELLAVYFGCSRFHLFTYARKNLVIETDHKPLIGLMKKDVNTLSSRLASLRLKLMPYSGAELKWRPGTELVVADMLSRSCPDGHGAKEDISLADSVCVDSVSFVGDAVDRYKAATANDEELSVLKKLILEGWPSIRKLAPVRVLSYWTIRGSLTVDDDLVYYGNRLVIPASMRAKVIDKLHSAHQGVTKSMLVASRSVYWPCMARHLQDRCLSCPECNAVGPRNKKEPMIGMPVPEYPFDVVASDIFYLNGKEFIILVDYFSKFPLVYELSSTRTSVILEKLKLAFSEYGIPRKFVSDNGPQYSSAEFKEFCRRVGMEHKTSSPNHQQANGQAERLVAVVKDAMKKCNRQDLWAALLTLRNTPIDQGLPSPAQLLQGRNMRTQLDVPSMEYTVKGYDLESTRQALEARKSKQKFYYDSHAGPEKEVLLVGQQVRFRAASGKWIFGTVVENLGVRSYVIETEQGCRFRRNRVDIRLSKEPVAHIRTSNQGVTLTQQNAQRQSVVETVPEIGQNNISAEVAVDASDVLGPGETRTRSGRIARKPIRFGDNIMS